MSEETLQRFLERLNSDEGFKQRLQTDWYNVIGELELSPAELAAVATEDEDALRRLAGAEVMGYRTNFAGTAVACSLLCFTTIDTPGSTRHCGTGRCATQPGSGQGCGTGDNCGLRAQ